MDIRPKKRTVLIAVTIAAAGVVMVSVLLARARGRASGQIAAGTASPPVAIVPQPTSPLQILSVAPITPQPPPGMPADRVPDFKAYTVLLKNLTGQDVILYALQLTSADAAQNAAPRGGKFTARFAAGPGKPALAAGQTKSDVVYLMWGRGELAIRVDVVLLDDGTAYGKNTSRALDDFQENISTRQALEHAILSALQSQGPEAAERLLKEQLAYLDSQVAKYMSPNWVD